MKLAKHPEPTADWFTHKRVEVDAASTGNIRSLR